MVNFKSQKGAISFMVLVSMLFFITFATGLYVSNANSEAAQVKASRRIKEVYERDINNMDGVYEKLTNGNVVDMPLDWTSTVKEIKKNVPIPIGFYYVGGTLNSGVVISDNAADENKGDTHDVAITLQGNQFVWVPVPGASISQMYDATNKRGIVYDFAANRVSTAKTYSSTGYREPDVVVGGGTEYDGVESYLVTAGMPSGSTPAQFKDKLQTEFNEMIASVSKYKGFYIGRYETGDSNQTIVVCKQGNINIGKQSWYTMYAKQKTLYSESHSVVSSMVWGNQWDRTLRWMNEDESTLNYVMVGTGKGNYSGTISGVDTWSAASPTGGHADFKVKNIYDMAGNMNEWTLEAYTTTYRTARGGYYTSSGVGPASRTTTYYPTNTYAYVGSRVQLYIK